jgi:predicted DNA-binding transcriptional regulator AlpA
MGKAARPAAPPPGDPSPDPFVGRLTYRIGEVAGVLGVCRRSLEREISAGRFPKADVQFRRMPLWRVETIRAWIERGGH